MVADGQANSTMSMEPGRTSQWKAGQWHHAALVWSAKQQFCRLFMDGAGQASSPYTSPAQGPARIISLSPSPTDLSGRTPACAVLDEFAMYDHPLSEEDISKLYRQGQELLAEQAANTSLEVSVYPNLAAGAKLAMNPKPNYGLPTYTSTCNDPDDEKQLSDGEKGTAHFGDLRSVGWMDSPKVVLDYDLGTLQRIAAVGVNIGAGIPGRVFPGRCDSAWAPRRINADRWEKFTEAKPQSNIRNGMRRRSAENSMLRPLCADRV